MSNLYSIVCSDRDDSKLTRLEWLNAHLAHMDTVFERVKLAAPLRDDTDEEFTGALLVITADSIDDAWTFIEADPYFKAGIWAEVRVDKLGTSAGEWVGGKPW